MLARRNRRDDDRAVGAGPKHVRMHDAVRADDGAVAVDDHLRDGKEFGLVLD